MRRLMAVGSAVAELGSTRAMPGVMMMVVATMKKMMSWKTTSIIGTMFRLVSADSLLLKRILGALQEGHQLVHPALQAGDDVVHPGHQEVVEKNHRDGHDQAEGRSEQGLGDAPGQEARVPDHAQLPDHPEALDVPGDGAQQAQQGGQVA